MRKILVLAFCIIFLTACSPYKVYQGAPDQTADGASATNNQQTTPEMKEVVLASNFSIIAQQATRNPPLVSGTIENKGLGAGDVKVIASIYYGGVVASQRNQVIENVKSKEKANFSIEFDTVNQWTSYSVIIEDIS
ncbi:MAG TPA: hypothetical protein VKE88_03785 [Candidatus Nanoarchaeia archaeon]|nr:hypothetical protein [Candidatus Nanoarchaeia archaeon]